MKKLLFIGFLFLSQFSLKAQCLSQFSYTGATVDSLSFTNLSVVSNAHYYWDLGDGFGTNEINPTHIYFSSGEYLVTLYVLDTISNCSDFYENWISVTKPDTIACSLYFTDSINTNVPSLEFTDLSSNCSGLRINCRVAGPGQNYCDPWLGGGWSSALFLHSIDAYTTDSILGYSSVKHFFRTRPFMYDPDKNYQNCSANFEINIDYQPNGALVTLTAMNKNASSYKFGFLGFGNPIYSTNPTASKLYPYLYEFQPWIVTLFTTDTVNNCSDTLTKQFIVVDPNYTPTSDCSTLFTPQDQIVVEGSNVQFIVSTSPYVNKQWQQNAGLGFVDLFNAGPFNGVHTDTLSISNVQLTMDNYFYRCIISNDSNGCHNTIPEIKLDVRPVGIDEVIFNNVKIYPNPAYDHLMLLLPDNLEEVEFKISDILGKEKMKSTLKRSEGKIDISDLSRGIYIIQLVRNGSSKREKFIKY